MKKRKAKGEEQEVKKREHGEKKSKRNEEWKIGRKKNERKNE